MKIERVYREILYSILEQSVRVFKQTNLSKKCKMSISTVNHALKPLERMNAIEKRSRGFIVIDAKKILIYWASIRNLSKEIVYQTYVKKTVEEIESEVPPNTIFTAYSAFKFRFKEIPSEYSEVVVYGRREDFINRFGKEEEGYKNLIVLDIDEHLTNFKIAPIAQIYVDLWNLRAWYAKEFLKRLEAIIDGILERYNY